MRNPGFIGTNDIQDIYLPMGFSNFKIEGRSLGSAIVLEFLKDKKIDAFYCSPYN